MIRSMSGHGRAEASSPAVRITVEVRSVNHRFGRIAVRLPGDLAPFEETVRRQVRAQVQRGKIDVSVTMAGPEGRSAQLDQEAAAAWIVELRELADHTGLTSDPRLADVLPLPGVLTGEPSARDDAATGKLLERAVADALVGFNDMRTREGADLAADLRARVVAMSARIDEVADVAEALPGRIRDQLRQRIADLLADTAASVDEDRIVLEAAHAAERADVTEEIVRLRSHLVKVEELLESAEPVGRTLEFVTQELHRELNTIGSKTKDLGVSQAIVDLKAELERLREQVQNIE